MMKKPAHRQPGLFGRLFPFGGKRAEVSCPGSFETTDTANKEETEELCPAEEASDEDALFSLQFSVSLTTDAEDEDAETDFTELLERDYRDEPIWTAVEAMRKGGMPDEEIYHTLESVY